MMKTTTQKRGFTAIELIIVISVIAIIAGIVIPAIAMAFSQRGKNTTKAVVETLATAMSGKDQTVNFVLFNEGQSDEEYRIRWDLNEDGIIDGNPDKDPSMNLVRTSANNLNIKGAFRELVPSLDKPTVDPNTEVIRDAWTQPLRITEPSDDYGMMGFGVYSVGKDGIAGNEDDITSWGRSE